MESFDEDREFQCSNPLCKESASWCCHDCYDTVLCDECEGCHSVFDDGNHQQVHSLADLTSETIRRIRARVYRTDFTAGHTTGSIEVKSETEALETGSLIVTTISGELNLNLVHVQFRPPNNVTIVNRYERPGGKVEVEFMAKVPGQLTAEVQVNEIHASTRPRPLVVNVKPQEMRITGQFNMEGVNIGTSEIRGIAVNRDNSRIAVANWSSHCVHVFTTDGDLLPTYGSQGSAQGQLYHPQGLAFLNDTDLVIADCGNHRICIVNTTTGTWVNTFGNQGHGNGQFCSPFGVHVDEDGNIIVCDRRNHRVQVFTGDGDYQYQFGLKTQDVLFISDVITHDGRFYVSHGNHVHVFKKIRNVPTIIPTIGGKGSGDGQLNGPWGLAIDNDHHLLVCDNGNNSVQKFRLDGRFVGKTCDVIKSPTYITVLRDGQLLVSTWGSGVWCVK